MERPREQVEPIAYLARKADRAAAVEYKYRHNRNICIQPQTRTIQPWTAPSVLPRPPFPSFFFFSFWILFYGNFIAIKFQEKELQKVRRRGRWSYVPSLAKGLTSRRAHNTVRDIQHREIHTQRGTHIVDYTHRQYRHIERVSKDIDTQREKVSKHTVHIVYIIYKIKEYKI